jgi:hypothetical protein
MAKLMSHFDKRMTGPINDTRSAAKARCCRGFEESRQAAALPLHVGHTFAPR